MATLDYLKALGVAALILLLDFACAFAAVSGWALLVEPGHPQSYYVAAAPAISTVSTRICGPLLFALFVWLFSRRKPGRNAYAFALAVFGCYLLIDGATVLFQYFFTPVVMLTMALKLCGAMAGAALARR